MNRTLNVVRMQLVNRATFVWVPLMVLGGSFLLTVAIWALVRSANPDAQIYVGGGSQAVIWYYLAAGIQALALTFPFSQAMSVTRRDYLLGTVLSALLSGVGLSVIYVVGAYLEEATGGWGLGGLFFRVPGLWDAGPFALALAVTGVTVMMFMIGFGCATFYRRFGPVWFTVLMLGIAVALVGALWFIGRVNAWGPMFAWLGAQGPYGAGLWAAAVALVIAGLSFVALRRATP